MAYKKRGTSSGRPAAAKRPGQPRAQHPGRRPARAPQRKEASAHPPRSAARPKPVRQETAGHAPVYDQDEGRRQPAGASQRAEQRQKRRRLTQAEMRRRRVRRRVITAFLVFCVIVAGILLSIVLLFKVNHFEVQNIDHTVPANTGVYSEEDIISAMGIAQGDNLFSFSLSEKLKAMNAAFPLLENIELHRRLPDTVIIRVRPATESYCIQTDAGWAILSQHLKVISFAGDQPDLPILTGTPAATPQQGETLSLAQEGADEALSALLDALDKAGLLSSVTQIDMTNSEEISFYYQGRVRVKIGTINNLDYKMEWSAYFLLNQKGDGCSETDTGIWDVSHLRSDGTIRPTFAQGDPYAQPTPIPEEAETPESSAESGTGEEAGDAAGETEDAGGEAAPPEAEAPAA